MLWVRTSVKFGDGVRTLVILGMEASLKLSHCISYVWNGGTIWRFG